MPRSGKHKNLNQHKNPDKMSYGAQVATISFGVILGIISAILIVAFTLFGDLIKTFL